MASDNNSDFSFATHNPDGSKREKPVALNIFGELDQSSAKVTQRIKDLGINVETINPPSRAATSGLPPFLANKLEEVNKKLGESTEDLRKAAEQRSTDTLLPSSVRPSNTNSNPINAGTPTAAANPTPVVNTPPVNNAQPQQAPNSNIVQQKPYEAPKLTPERKQKIRSLPGEIKEQIYGQDAIVDEVVDVLKVALLGLSANKKKPRGAYLFAGPSGCGKTETVVQIARLLDIPIKKFSMAEFSEENDVKKLIGSPPGYVGYEDGGQLTNFIKEHPNGIVLFDEIEKADEALGKILLGVLDDGKLTDNMGVEVSFTNTIFFATSNLGAEIEYSTGVSTEDKNEYRMSAIRGHFPPEVINRFDSIIQFFAVNKEVYGKIVKKVLGSLSKDFKSEHEIEFSYDDKIIDFIVENSYDPAMGGRPAGRFMSKVLIKGIVDKMFEDSMDGVDFIKLDLSKDGNVCFKNREGVSITEVMNTSDLLSRYNASRMNKEEEKLKAKAAALAASAGPALEEPTLPIKPVKDIFQDSNDKSLTHTETELSIAGAAGPLTEKIAKKRVDKRSGPKRA